MALRTGRPLTDRKPNTIVLMNHDSADSARQAARYASKQIGQWLEEAITEKRRGEKETGNVTKGDY